MCMLREYLPLILRRVTGTQIQASFNPMNCLLTGDVPTACLTVRQASFNETATLIIVLSIFRKHKALVMTLLCLCIRPNGLCISTLLLGNSSVKTLQWQRIYKQQQNWLLLPTRSVSIKGTHVINYSQKLS
jgi:hypothetical protein